MLILRINNVETDIIYDVNGSEFISEFIALRDKLSFRPEGYLYSPKYKKKQWDGWKRLAFRNLKRCYFPTGLLSLAREHLEERGIQYRIVDLRYRPEKNYFIDFNDKDYPLRDYQINDIKAAMDKTRGIISAATGSGKTILSAKIIQECGVKPFLFLVTSIDLMEQTKESFESTLSQNGTKIHVGRIGGGVCDIQDINIMTAQTAVRALGKKFIKFDSESKDDQTSKSLLKKHRKEIINVILQSKGVICDECQHVRSDMCQIVTKAMKNAYYRYGASATAFRDQGDDMLIQSCFGKIVCDTKASELIQKGYLVKPEIYFIHINPTPSFYKSWHNIYKEQIVENEYYNSIIANLAEEYIKLDKTILILVQQINHGKTLESMIEDSLFVYGDSPKKERISALNKLRNHYIKCLISTSLFDEGIDCKILNTLILGGGGRSKTRAIQRVGRALRLYKGKEKSTIIDFFIHEKYLEDHAKAREKIYKSEPEFVVKHTFIE